MSKSPDPYAVLGVTAAATPAEISHAFRAKLRTLHPDAGNAGRPPTADAEEQLQQLLGAYARLRQGSRHQAGDERPPPASSNANRQGPVQVPVTYRGEPAPTPRKDLWAGPVRRHR
ncbi:hypothetical protein ABW16_08685 [Mycolicibacter heraklionensis]|uniref:J domain-containing protein n=1 Tax=Mycolicibacter heraklionensis TaxID=512402 RepID=A0ABR5FGT3_9MYCO|nr:J domain-containing protein [Mycolicibacter heraklionensis]KLO29687.1 hypothetical protein ABW16_08685 [Mycolicibacter heraklionensis]